MAFKPIVIEKEIDGVLYKAQFNGMSALYDARAEFGDNDRKAIEYQLKHVIVEPQIDDMDEYFGTDIEHMNEVITFAGKVMSAHPDYFPKTFKEKSKKTSN